MMNLKQTTALCAVMGLVACGDNLGGTPDAKPGVDAAVQPDGPEVLIDAAPDAPPDGTTPFVAPTPFAVPLSVGGPDQLQSAAAGPNDTFFAAGFAAQTLAGSKFVTVVKRNAAGPIAAFGTAGVATTQFISASGGAGEVGIAVQASGKVVVIATVANALVAADRDVVVFRLDGTTGALDTTFGTNGSTILDFNTALDPGQSAQRDGSRSVAIGPGGVIYVLATQRNPGVAATDSDFGIARLTVDGVLDTTFGTAGKVALDIQQVNATPRGIRILPDGSIIAAGYANTPVVGNTTQIVLYKLTSNGALDAGFATGGVFHDIVLATQTEAYNIAIHGGNIVTGGYGRNTGTTNDWISLRFNATTGVRDLTWGMPAFTDGRVFFDPSGVMLGSNCRYAHALPDGKTLLLGSTGPSNMPAQDAVFAVLDASGQLDTAYGDGVHQFALGANGNDQFWGAAASSTHALIVGYKGGGATPTDTVNDDAFAVLVPLQ